MRWGSLMDPVANRLLDLQKVSGTQWLLRATAAAAMGVALVGALPGGLFGNFGAAIVTLAVTIVALVQFVHPDSDIGILASGAIILALAGQGDLSMLRAIGVGLALLISHSAFALAATIPVHGVFVRSAWLLSGRALLTVLAVSLAGGLVVLALAGIQFGPWMLVIGILAVIALFATLLPRAR